MLERIRNIICEYVDTDPALITIESSLRNDIGATSFDLMNIAVAIEDEYKTNIPNSRLLTIKTVGDIICAVEEKRQVKAAQA